jgi:hypothetical protein
VAGLQGISNQKEVGMTEAEDARKEIDMVLKGQDEKGVKRWQIAVSLFSKGFSEKQVGVIMNINHRSAHAFKINFSNNKARREIKNHLKMDIVTLQRFLKNIRILVGEPHGSGKGDRP